MPHDPADLDALPLERKALLLSGRDFWSTEPVEEAGLPSVVLTDGPHGVRRQQGEFDQIGLLDSAPATCFPPAVAVGSSWDPEVAERIGAAVGREARALGVPVVLGPGVNIKRSPLCGRNFEYYSEDPLLTGVLGAAHVRGQQGEGVGASVKHFAANNQETQRMQVSADVDERTLREIYLPAFERVVTEAQPATVMCAYNKINGVYASQHRWLLTDVLRDEWGFAGAVVSDWGAVDDRVAALEAGLDLQMPGDHGAGNRLVIDAVEAGRLDVAVVDRSVRRVAALADLVTEPTGGFDVDAHHALARELAAGCAVLLRNERGTLPLAPDTRIAVVGEFARTPRYQGGGSSHVNATRVDDPLGALQELLGTTVPFAPGFTLDGSGDAPGLREEALAIARKAEVTVVFAGLAEHDESEGFDRTTLDLPSVQVELIRGVAAACPRTVVVLSTGGVVSLEGWHDDVDAVLAGFLLGQAGGGALADLLTGAVDPSGRLAETIPLRLQDTPSYLNFPGEQGHVRYGEGVMVGYRHVVTADAPVRYPFGHGLSYTTVETTELQVRPTGNDGATVSVTVTNTGTRSGRHVVQVYVATSAGPVRRPARELRGFAKVSLEPGESRTVSVELDRRAFAYWDVREGGWVVAPGEYTVQIGRSSTDIEAEATLTLAGDDVVPHLTLQSSVAEWFGHPVIGAQLLEGFLATLPDGAGEMHAGMLQMIGSMPMRRFTADFGSALPAAELDRLMAQGRTGGRLMLRPQDSATRERKKLDGMWRFALDADGVGRAAGWERGPLPDAREVAVPASYNDLFADAAVRDHVGDAWYQTTVRVPRGWAGQRVVLRFDAATHRAVVWVDDVEVMAHEGGYTPFEADVTAHVRPGQEARITVVVDNRLTWQSIPPGVVLAGPSGPKQTYFHDFFNYAGLHRSVWLYCTPVAHIDDITVVPGLDGTRGTVGYRVGTSGAGQVRVVFADAGGTEVAHADGAEGLLTVEDVHPWRPGEGYLYDLRVSLADGDEVLDSYTLPVGVRTVEVRGTQFLINGEPFRFTGFGKHEDLPVKGKGHDDAWLLHDVALMDWIGANSFRTSHYPYAEEVLEYADRHGIVVIDEAAAVGQNMGLAAVALGVKHTTFSPETIDDRSREVHAQAIRELVARDKNHPSVVLWSIANEPESDTDAAVEYFEPLFALTRELDPTRPVGSVNMMFAPHGRDRLQEFGDVVMLNRYYGWYAFTGDLAGAEAALEKELAAWAGEGKPILVTEYGADAMPGVRSVTPQPWSEEYQAEFLAMYHRVFDRIDAVVGEHVWSFADFATSTGISRVDGNRKGVFTRDRRPKAAAFLLRRRWRPEQ